VNHGIPDAVIDEMLAATELFFSLSTEKKLRYKAPSLEANRGYAARESEVFRIELPCTNLF
jgi:isopenicillin N synthase-like dioxygenase